MISLRLDAESEVALRALTASGRSRSDAIRSALVETARRRRDLAAEAALVRDDPDDRAEVERVRELMESLRAAW